MSTCNTLKSCSSNFPATNGHEHVVIHIVLFAVKKNSFDSKKIIISVCDEKIYTVRSVFFHLIRNRSIAINILNMKQFISILGIDLYL